MHNTTAKFFFPISQETMPQKSTESNQMEYHPGCTLEQLAQQILDSKKFNANRNRLKGTAPRTIDGYKKIVKVLCKHFTGPMPPTLGQIREYQEKRSETAGSYKINRELRFMIYTLRKFNLWTDELVKEYIPLEEEGTEIPRVPTIEEQEHFLSVASSSDEFKVMYCYSLIVLASCASSYEMRQLRIMDVSHGNGLVYFRWGKNLARVRSCPLGEKGPWAVEELKKIAAEKGSKNPEHFLFPKWDRTKLDWEPREHCSDWGLVKPWEALREAAGFPWFKCNNLRHTALTRYAEAGTPIEVLMDMAGHMSFKMTRHYRQISDAAKLRWAQNLAARKLPSAAVSSTAHWNVSISS